ncbi:phosphoethanolamine--lipid A transferase [Massilia sp. RP-1-19]|uniref:Phosphoethanolamine--lipid A transferase n=1 Tax=Massilia polaris TaxID=2728846 RepID=A0A848HX00_9BURK|nr:phosphoethanolamine--lipid A transferase [Massilia polaris]
MPNRVGAAQLTLAVSAFLAAVYNLKFWETFTLATGGLSLANLPLHVAAFILVVLIFNALLTMASFRFVIKPVLIALLVATSVASYFMNQYGVVIDKSMVQNVLETDVHEATELVSWHFALMIAVLGILPSLVVARAKIDFPEGPRGLAFRLGTGAASLAVAALLLILFFKSLAPALREHRELRYLLTPTNYVQALHGYLRNRFSTPLVVAPLGTDAIKGRAWAGTSRNTVTVIVVGETARAQNFSLNGYGRNTNPMLSQQAGLINFANFQSCGTATAISVPCVFSALGRDNFSDSKARRQEGLLDVLSHAGFTVLWRDNNSGCKGVCERIGFEDMSAPTPSDPLCEGDECFDERMLKGLQEMIRDASNDLVLVLHQKGSHGPAYSRRYPAKFGRFGPVCDAADFEKCSNGAITAAYDNTIVYTDYFLSKAIDLLRDSSKQYGVDASLVYFSDHGESLGENKLYLHGAPYVIAPPEQTHVPFMLWMSEGFSERFRIDRACLNARREQPFSHDNIFHSMLGMLNVNTAVFNPRLNLFGACTHEG